MRKTSSRVGCAYSAATTPGIARTRRERHRVGELDLDPAPLHRLAEQVVDPLDRDQPAVADDPDPVADALDLVELVRGEEDRAAALAFLAHQGEELLLHQRVQAARRLVEDEQVGAVEEGEDQADLLAVAARELAQRPLEVGPEAPSQLFGAARSVDAAQPRQQASASRPLARLP